MSSPFWSIRPSLLSEVASAKRVLLCRDPSFEDWQHAQKSAAPWDPLFAHASQKQFHPRSSIPMPSIRPLHDRIIVKRSDPETKTASGIVIPDSAGEKPEQGEVLAVGPGKRNDQGERVKPDVKPGDKVIFGKYGGQTVKLGGDEVLVLREEDILGVLEA
jgi:chaperonin GroES